MRKQKRIVNIGGVKIGGDNPVAIQSMCNTDTRDVKATVNQIHELENAGCEIIRVAVPDMVAAKAVADIKKQIHIPLVVDIHFDYRLAIAAMETRCCARTSRHFFGGDACSIPPAFATAALIPQNSVSCEVLGYINI